MYKGPADRTTCVSWVGLFDTTSPCAKDAFVPGTVCSGCVRLTTDCFDRPITSGCVRTRLYHLNKSCMLLHITQQSAMRMIIMP